MTQRKPSDKVIDKQFPIEFPEKCYGKNFSKQHKEYIIKENTAKRTAAKWARDYDPWHYVEDGELPALHALVKHRNGTDKVSKKILFKVNDGSLGYYATGHYRFYENKDGKRYYFEEESTQTEFEISEIKCFQYIEEPQK